MLLPSIRSLKLGSLFAATVVAAALPAMAGDVTATTTADSKKAVIEKPMTEPRFYLQLTGGGEFDTGYTNFLTNGFNGLPSNNPPARPAFLSSFQARDFNETHDAAVVNGRLELGYNVLPYLSVFSAFTYSHAGGNDRANVGFVTDNFGAVGPAGTNYNLLAGVGQYQSISGMAGFKLHTPRTILDLLHLPKAITPYLSVSAGGKYIDDQDIRFFSGAGTTVPDRALVDTGRLLLYHASVVFTAEAQLGYELKLTHNFSVVFENGYGYDTKPERGSLPSTYSGINRGADRLYSTASLGGKLSF